MYQKVTTDQNFAAREEDVLKFWQDNDVFKRTVAMRKGGATFTFFDGPPTSNGKPHIGHVLTRAIKDIIPRYRTMKGYDVLRKAGWDTHGLPVELEVEKMLGLDGKPQIEKYGIEPFIKECKKSVWKYKTEWEKMSERVGYWADMENPYITYEDNYIESEWWSLKEIYKKNLLYKGYKIVPYCPRCGTALSSHEVAQGYKTVKERSAVVRFKAKGEDAWFLAWTTTPWTLCSNTALCVNPDETYAKVKHTDGYTYYLAQALADKILGEGYEVLETYVGSQLERREYEPLYACAAEEAEHQGKKAHYVTCDGYVTMSDGTGIVHIAPAFGEDDARIGRNYDLPFIQMVDSQGRMKDETPFAGMRAKPSEDEIAKGAVSADPEVLKDLQAKGLLFAAPKFEHDYPYCWRCDTPLLYYARQSWFIRMTAVHDQLMRNNRAVNWMPDHIKEGRMGNFLENVIDWGLSRERYWGTPLPVWTCKCGYVHVIGSRKELMEMGHNVDPNLELHRPYIDNVVLTCPKCGGDMHREKEVIDCWYDSGSMPFAQWHYPFENKEQFESHFPANFISEAIDQTRGWFYTLLAISTCMFNTNPFENCIVLGHVQDAEGRKQSKHVGNCTDPWVVLNDVGADATRWYFYNCSAPWVPSRCDKNGSLIKSSPSSKFLSTLWNTYAFFILYADIDQFNPKDHDLSKCELTLMDKWVMSRLSSTVKAVDEHLMNYRIFEGSRVLADFVDELSNWYVRLNRARFYGDGKSGTSEAAFATLYHVLDVVTRLSCPFTPFMAENIYQNLVRSVDPEAPLSVNMTDYPACDEAAIDAELEERMKSLQDVVFLGRSCRNLSNLKVRQPLSRMYVSGADLPEEYWDLAKQELNIGSVEETEDTTAFMTYQLKPQMRTLGKKYGKLLKAIGEKLSTLDGNEVVANFAAGNTLNFELDGTAVVLEKDDVLTNPVKKEGYVMQTDKGVTVALDTNLTDELIAAGYVKEVVSKLQTMRKDAGFEVTDRIHVAMQTEDAKLASVVEANKETIMASVLALDISVGGTVDGMKDWDINGVPAKLGVVRA